MEQARVIADLQSYNDKANALYETGKEKFGDWDDSVQNLNAAGIIAADSPTARSLIEAALATGSAPEVIRHLGKDLTEAERIAAMSPVRMGVELAQLAQRLTKPKTTAISGAPAPIGGATVRGAAEPTVDLAKLAQGDDMAAWVAARKKAGDPWATGRR